MCVPCGSAPRERIDLRAVGLRIPLIRLEMRGEVRERLLSYRDPASRDPRTGCVSETCSVLLRTRAPFRLLSARASRQARLRASFRLAPCVRRRALRPLGDQDARCVRSTSATRTMTCTRTSCVPGRLHGLRRVLVARSLGSARHDQGREHFTMPRPRFGGSGLERIRRVPGISPGDHDQGPVRPEALQETVPLTPLSLLSSLPNAPSLRSWGRGELVFARDAPVGRRERSRGRLARALVKERGA
jgi:hypothetical protein